MITISKMLRIACLAAVVGAAAGLAMPDMARAQKTSAEEKAKLKARAKECSEKADKQKLHGKARFEFREKCKREAG